MTTIYLARAGVLFEREAEYDDVVLRGDEGGEALVFQGEARAVEIVDLVEVLASIEPEEAGRLDNFEPSEREWERALEGVR